MDTPTAAAPKMSKKTKMWIIIGVIIVVVGAGVMIYIFKFYMPKKRIEKATNIWLQWVLEVNANGINTPNAINLDNQLLNMGFTAGLGPDGTTLVLMDTKTNTMINEANSEQKQK